MLDFKGWSKIGEDKKTTTLKHDKGHVMTLAHTKLPKIQQEHLKRLKLAGGTPDGTVGDTKDDGTQTPSTNININAAPTPQPGQSMQSTQPAPINIPQAPATPSVTLPNGSMSAPGVAQTAQSGMDLNAQVAAEKGKADAVYQKQFLDERARQAQLDQQHIADLKGHTDDFANYMKTNPINPNAYLENMNAGRKMQTGLGLLLGGFGSGLGGGPNMALDSLNKQIDRNIDAQKARSEQAKTVYGAYKDLYGNENIATNLAKVSANDILVHQAEMTAAQLNTPQVQANLMQLKAQKAAENNKLILDSAGNLSSTPNMPKGGSGGGQQMQQSPQGGAPAVSDKSDQSGFIGGPPSGNASIPKGQVSTDYYDNHILAPDAVQKFKNLAYTPKAKEDLAAIQSQYNQATQAEKGLNDVRGKFSQLASETNGVSGRIHRGMNPHAVAAVGGALGLAAAGIPSFGLAAPAGAAGGAAAGEALGHGIQSMTNTNANRTYDSDKTALLGYLSAALKGTNIGSGQIQEIVDNNSPESGDSPKLLAKKEQNIKDFILNHTDTSLLKTWGLSKK